MLRWFYTILKVKRQCQKLQFLPFLLKNPIYTLRRITETGMHMEWDAFSEQLKNHENRKNLGYPKFEKTG